ncbi:MAG: peptidoglycan-binding protein LysM [Candidatus Sabulitectum sp.]|nr:peptidoglycan-binding protein LysM [Candidatus Sabulitectum sp.]
MGLFDFAADMGRNLFNKEEDAPKKIQEHIEEDNPGISDLLVAFKNGVVTLSGKADDSAAVEKAILMAGNIKGVSEIINKVLSKLPIGLNTEYYEIKSGDTLWAVAKNFYGDGNKYLKIVEANKEVIKDADKIFPGQKIRIPKI